MNSIQRRKIFLYSAVFIALAVNSPQLFALRDDRVFSYFVTFNLNEFFFRILYSFLYCAFFFYFNSKKQFYSSSPAFGRQALSFLINLVLLLVITRVGYRIDIALFKIPSGMLPGAGYGIRLMVSAVLMAIEIKIINLLSSNKEKELENQYLRNAYLKAELELLKGQLNPHFFFNALSSLSGIVREDAEKAQHYIGQLSKFFRYTLKKTSGGMVPLHDELSLVASYFDVLAMRHEGAVKLDIAVEKAEQGRLMPHMSLQPLIENAVKHNVSSMASVLYIQIAVNNGQVIVSNNLQPHPLPPAGSGIGLANLNERYKILTGKEIDIYKTESEFSVKLPLASYAP